MHVGHAEASSERLSNAVRTGLAERGGHPRKPSAKTAKGRGRPSGDRTPERRRAQPNGRLAHQLEGRVRAYLGDDGCGE